MTVERAKEKSSDCLTQQKRTADEEESAGQMKGMVRAIKHNYDFFTYLFAPLLKPRTFIPSGYWYTPAGRVLFYANHRNLLE